MRIIEYEDKYLEDVRDLLVELEEYILTIDEYNLDQLHPEYREKMALIDLEEVRKYEGKCYIAVEDNKAKKEELTNELSGKATGMFGMFFNSEKTIDGVDFKSRCINASKITIIMMVTTALFFLDFRNSDIMGFVFNLLSLILFGFAYIELKKGDIKGVYAGLFGAALCVVSFNIIKMAMGAAYILGMLYLLSSKKEEERKEREEKEKK